jgi:hypothetical protein
MFKEKNALPRSELHLSIDNRNRLTGARQCHSDMRWHVIAALGTVCEVVGIFGHKPIEERFQVAARARVGIFHNQNAATRVLNKNGRCPISHFGFADLRLHIICDFVQSFSIRSNFELFVMHVHKQTNKALMHVLVIPRTRRRRGTSQLRIQKMRIVPGVL